MRPEKWRDITNRLRVEIMSGRMDSVPSIAELAENWGVSYPTMHKAMGVLSREGLVDISRGSAPRLAGPLQASGRSPVTPDDAAGRLLERMRTQILDGQYRAGEALPKTAHLTASEGISSKTIAETFRRLAQENLAHKVGKRWIAGARPPASEDTATNAVPSEDAPAIVLLSSRETNWLYLFRSMFTFKFVNTLNEEIARHGMRLHLALEAKEAQPGPPSGMDEVRSYVSSLGKRYMGTLAFFGACMDTRTPDLAGELVHWGKPVVCFDASEECGSLRVGTRGSNIYRCHQDNRGAVELALQRLCALGHRRIGVPLFHDPDSKWVTRRVELIRSVAATLSPSPRIFTAVHDEKFWKSWDWDEMFQEPFTISEELLRKLSPSGPKAQIASPSKTLLNGTPSMKHLLLERDVTAIISLNDRIACDHLAWLNAVGLSVPRHVSLISFDNEPETAVVPISTMDFGFSRLGYLAAHVLIGDLPIRADRSGDIPGRCVIIDRGSLGPPREGGLPVG